MVRLKHPQRAAVLFTFLSRRTCLRISAVKRTLHLRGSFLSGIKARSTLVAAPLAFFSVAVRARIPSGNA